MLEHEQRFYSEIVKILKGFREEILNQKPNPICDQIEHSIEPRTELTTKTSEVAAGDEVKNEPGRETTIKTEDELEAEPEQIVQLDSEIDQGTPEDNSEQVLVQVLEDIEQFVGTDLITYNLHKEDLATIPKEIAQILQNNNKVRVVEPNL